ncbi:unnamed protein product [Closterium sp. Naga37s-1]|nr:unnamed protein product [Closterium sp. Naga37s-1]
MAGGGRPEGYNEGRAWKARVLSTTATGGMLVCDGDGGALVCDGDGGALVCDGDGGALVCDGDGGALVCDGDGGALVCDRDGGALVRDGDGGALVRGGDFCVDSVVCEEAAAAAAAAAVGAAQPAAAIVAVTSNCCIAAFCVAGLEEAVREVRFSLASDPTNGLLGGALAGALFGRLRGEQWEGWEGRESRDIAIRAAVMFGLAGAGHRAAVETFKEWRIQQLMAARAAEHTASPHSPHADMATDRDGGVTAGAPASHAHMATDTDGRVTVTDGTRERTATTGASPLMGGVGERGEQVAAKAGGRWEWPEWLPVRRLGEEEVKQRQEEFRRRVAAAQRLEMAGGGRDAGMGGAEGREKGE